MDASEMSVEELQAALAAKQGLTVVDGARTVEVRGHTFTITPDIDKSWECVDFALALGDAQADSDRAMEVIAKAFALVELATGYDRKALYQLYGNVGMSEFFQIVGELAGNCLPKN